MIKPVRTLAVTSVAMSLTLVASACGGGHSAKNTPTPTPSTSTSTSSAAPSPTHTAAAINPLTGLAPSPNAVVAAKIDDTGNGRPQMNIDSADVVYIEQVEGGLTRLIAVFNTTLPTVEAVRSVRANDPELLAQYGPIGFAASGGAPNPLFVLDHSSLRASINDRGGPGFARDGNRGAPYNLTANLATVASAVHAAHAKDVGFVWNAAVEKSLAGFPAGTAIHTVVGATNVDFAWDNSIKRYVRYIGGVAQHQSNGAFVSTPNVIVQFCQVTPYPQDVDVVGNVAQFTHSVGSGRAVVYRNGHRINGKWARPSSSQGTSFTDAKGLPISLMPGGVWVILVATNAPLS
jgi:hypothetical protein